MIAGIFPGKVIIVADGKLSYIRLTNSWNLCYPAFHETTWLQKRKLVEVKLGNWASQNHFCTAAGKPAA